MSEDKQNTTTQNIFFFLGRLSQRSSLDDIATSSLDKESTLSVASKCILLVIVHSILKKQDMHLSVQAWIIDDPS